MSEWVRILARFPMWPPQELIKFWFPWAVGLPVVGQQGEGHVVQAPPVHWVFFTVQSLSAWEESVQLRLQFPPDWPNCGDGLDTADGLLSYKLGPSHSRGNILKNHRRHLRQLDVVLCLMYERYIFQICRIYALQIFYGKVSWKLYVISNWRSISTAHLCWCLSCCSRTHSRGKISDSYTRWHQVTSHCVL